MANVITGKVWSLDTVAGLVSLQPVCIHSIIVRFTTAGAGSCIITTSNSTTDIILDLTTTAASTAVVWQTSTQFWLGDQFFTGLYKFLSVNVSTIYVITSNAQG